MGRSALVREPTRQNPYFNSDFEDNDAFETSGDNDDLLQAPSMRGIFYFAYVQTHTRLHVHAQIRAQTH